MVQIAQHFKMENKILLILILGIFLISFASAESIGTFKQNDCVNLPQLCSTCTFNNITSIAYPNGSIVVSNVAMNKDGSYFNYTSCNISNTLGTWKVSGIGNDADCSASGCVWAYTFEVTQSGLNSTTGGSVVYIALLGLLIFLFILNAIGISKLPHTNPRADSGNIISVSLLKYLKPTLLVLGWGIIIAILFLSSNIAEAYLGHSFGNLFFALFKLLASWQLIMLVVFLYIIWNIVNIFRDIKLKQFFDRGYAP